jgi:hypothetical protein
VLYKSNDRVPKAKNEREAKGICTLERGKLGRVMEEPVEVQCMLWGLTVVPSSSSECCALKVKVVLSETSGKMGHGPHSCSGVNLCCSAINMGGVINVLLICVFQLLFVLFSYYLYYSMYCLRVNGY